MDTNVNLHIHVDISPSIHITNSWIQPLSLYVQHFFPIPILTKHPWVKFSVIKISCHVKLTSTLFPNTIQYFEFSPFCLEQKTPWRTFASFYNPQNKLKCLKNKYKLIPLLWDDLPQIFHLTACLPVKGDHRSCHCCQ